MMIGFRGALRVGVVVICLGAAAGASSAFASTEYLLDPVLTLTGSCKTSKNDPVPDPGCPEGKHPPEPFNSPRSTVTDSYGDIYVSSYGNESANGAEGRIDIFDSSGFFLEELPAPVGPKDLAVDTKGNLYVIEFHSGGEGLLLRYEPTVYKPESGEIKYGAPPAIVLEDASLFISSIAIDPIDDHLFVNWGHLVAEYGSATEKNKALDESIGAGVLNKSNGQGIAIDAAHGLLYADDLESVRVFELAPPHKLLRSIDGSETPNEKFTRFDSVAADEATGNVFILDGESSKSLYEFSEAGKFIATVKKNLLPIFGSEASVDNGPFSPHPGYLFALSEESGIGVSFAFEPPSGVCPPEVESVSFANVTREDAELAAMIDPCGGETGYTFEYTTQEEFDEEGFANAQIAGQGQLSAGKAVVTVSVGATGLSPETSYRFRVAIVNEEGEDEVESGFTTYTPSEEIPPCPNDAVRTGLSALLPDCRAYELVTPPDTNARAPRGIGKTSGIYFATREASPGGGKVSFITEGGTIPGNEGTGSLSGDAYLSTRSADGWSTASAGPNGVEAVSPLVGSTSPDQGYSFWESGSEGSAAIEGKATSYVRYSDGHSELVGQGDLGTDPGASGKLISDSGGHITFVSGGAPGRIAVQLEPNAPPNGTAAIYDRTSNEVTHVVSLLPGGATPAAGQNAFYQGASLDGRGVAFKLGSTTPKGPLYLRYNNEETFEVAEEGATFAGIAEGGKRIFYLREGNLFAYEIGGESNPIAFSSSGNVTPVNVADNGNAAFFASPSVLTAEPNPAGALPVNGGQNLYRSEEGILDFVGTVTKRDVEGELGSTDKTEGLGLWTTAVGPSPFGDPGRFAEDPSRTTPDGSVLLFESRAALDGYDPEGHAEIYRYDFPADTLDCLSCNPTQASATGDASLQSVLQVQGGPEPFNSFALVANLRADGRRAFFQSPEPLVIADTDGLQDVYEWEDQGIGSCTRPGGCIYLISSGQSDRVDYLYGVSDSGDDVFIRSADLLVPADTDRTPSIYDAKVGGGFPEEDQKICLAESCKPGLSPPPVLPSPGALPGRESGNVRPSAPRCPKGKHRVKRHGKAVCVKKHHKRKHHKAGAGSKGVAK